MESNLLVQWLNFSTASEILPNKDITTILKGAVKDLKKEDADIICAKNTLHFKISNFLQISSPRIRTDLREKLQLDASIVVLPPDKGRATFTVNREYHSEKCIDHKNSVPYQFLKKP